RQRSRILYREAGAFKLGCGGGGGTLVYGIGRTARIARSSNVRNGASRARETPRSPPAERHGRFWRRAGSVVEARFARKQLPPRAEAESARSARPLLRTAFARIAFACGRHGGRRVCTRKGVEKTAIP